MSLIEVLALLIFLALFAIAIVLFGMWNKNNSTPIYNETYFCDKDNDEDEDEKWDVGKP
jgi:hypothetical protein